MQPPRLDTESPSRSCSSMSSLTWVRERSSRSKVRMNSLWDARITCAQIWWSCSAACCVDADTACMHANISGAQTSHTAETPALGEEQLVLGGLALAADLDLGRRDAVAVGAHAVGAF